MPQGLDVDTQRNAKIKQIITRKKKKKKEEGRGHNRLGLMRNKKESREEVCLAEKHKGRGQEG